MAFYRRAKGNIRRAPRRRRATTRRRSVKTTAVRRRRQARKQQDCKCPGELTPTAKFALAQLDPFEPKCMGAKVPDSNTIPSISNTDQDQVTLASGATASHLYGIAFNPAYSWASLTAGSGTALNWTINGWTPRRNQAAVLSNIEAIRPVAHAIKMSSPLAPTTTTGFVHFGLAVESRRGGAVGGPDLPLTVNEMTGLPHYKRVTLASLTQSPVTVINKWLDETAFRYDDPNAVPELIPDGNAIKTFTLNFNGSWASIVVMVEGAPTSQNILSFEHLLISEMIPKRSAFILGSTAAPNSPGTMSAVSTMQSETDFSHTEAEQESYINQGLAELQRGAAVVGEQVYRNVAEPLMNRLGQYAVNTATRYAVGALMGRGGLPGVNSNPNRLALS